MGHLREISDDEVTIDILPYCNGEFGLVSGKRYIFENFFDSNGITFLIWYLYSNETESWDGCLDTD